MCGLLFVSYTRRYIRRRLSLEGGALCVEEMSVEEMSLVCERDVSACLSPDMGGMF
jgi:hypothetical protein